MKKRSNKNPNFDDPPSDDSFEQLELDELQEADLDNTEVEDEVMSQSEIEITKSNVEASLFAIEGVVGVGIGSNEIGDDAIVVYLRDESSQERIPTQIEGFPVITEVSGEFDAFKV